MNKRSILGLVLVIIAFIDINPISVIEYVKNHIPSIKPTPSLVIDKPDQQLIDFTKPVADLVTDNDDRVACAVFFYEFSNRKYSSVTLQNLNDIVTEAGKEYFNSSQKGKYPNFAEGIKKLMLVTEVESADSKLSESELLELSKRFKALAWNLVN